MAAGALGGSPLAAQGIAQYVYAVKFVCALVDGVTAGHYETAINIHNPQLQSVTFRKKAVIARPASLPGLPPSGKTNETLAPDWAREITCQIISQILAVDPKTVGFTGFLVLESPVELDVVAVYTKYSTDIRTMGEKNLVYSGPEPRHPPDEPFPRAFPVDPVTGEALPAQVRVRPGQPEAPPLPPRKPIEATAVQPQGPAAQSGSWGTGMGLGLGVGVGTSMHVEYIQPKRLIGGRYVSRWR
jgi:hypothetical protein